jgi:voltage-gated potassium channel
MKRTNSFILFGRAFKYASRDFWVSVQVLFWLTLVLAILFYLFEHEAQPEEYSNPLAALVWAVTRYIGDPGHFSGAGPVTLCGRYIDTAIGILKILIFAVPAGLVGNGFRKAMDEDKHRMHLEKCHERIIKCFRRTLDKATHLRVQPHNVAMVTIQAKKGMTENDIIDTIRKYPDLRLRNLATSQPSSERPQDRLVVEMIPSNKFTVDGFAIEQTAYGVKINRNSPVTIIAPTAGTECTIGYFAYYVAQYGSFNFVSRELVEDVDDPVSYFTVSDDSKEHLQDYLNDIRLLSIASAKNHWNIVMVSAENIYETQLHLVSQFKKGSDVQSTVLDETCLQKLYAHVSEVLNQNHNLLSDLNDVYRPVGTKNVAVKAGAGVDNNGLVIRISYGMTTWNDHCVAIALDMAKSIRQTILSEAEWSEQPEWKMQGHGFGIDEA